MKKLICFGIVLFSLVCSECRTFCYSFKWLPIKTLIEEEKFIGKNSYQKTDKKTKRDDKNNNKELIIQQKGLIKSYIYDNNIKITNNKNDTFFESGNCIFVNNRNKEKVKDKIKKNGIINRKYLSYHFLNEDTIYYLRKKGDLIFQLGYESILNLFMMIKTNIGNSLSLGINYG